MSKRFSRRILLTLMTLLLAGGLISAAATASRSSSSSRSMTVGIFDDSMTLGNPGKGFPLLKNLRTQVVRMTLWWGGPIGVATERPTNGANPADPAYEWTMYDRAVQAAKAHNIRILFSITGTPAWANGRRSTKFAPTRFKDLQNFAAAAAKRYSGTFKDRDDKVLPAVRLWLAWNEPNNPVFLFPQYRKVNGRFIAQSAYSYVRICNAIYQGVHGTGLSGERVACGATDPFGNNQARSRRPSISPLAFLRTVKKFGLRKFDAWAHHPYAGRPTESPTTKPRAKTAVTLGNFGDLVKELTRLYGKKRIWITEYGYQTRPPDRAFGVAWKTQAKYLAQAYAIVRNNSRVDMMIWFLVKDERRLGGWQSGFFTYAGRKKPAYNTFRRLKH
jgi:Glycosyl hydrolase catalytic core